MSAHRARVVVIDAVAIVGAVKVMTVELDLFVRLLLIFAQTLLKTELDVCVAR